MGFLSGLLGGGSSKSVSASNVTSEIQVDVENTIDTTGLGAGIAEAGKQNFLAAIAAALNTREIAEAQLQQDAAIANTLWGSIDKLGKIVALIGGAYFLIQVIKK